MTVNGQQIIENYNEVKGNIFKAIEENNVNLLGETNVSLLTFIKENKNKYSWRLNQPEMINLEDYLLDLPVSLRKSFIQSAIEDERKSFIQSAIEDESITQNRCMISLNDRLLVEIMGPSNLIYKSMTSVLNEEEKKGYRASQIKECELENIVFNRDNRTCQDTLCKKAVINPVLLLQRKEDIVKLDSKDPEMFTTICSSCKNRSESQKNKLVISSAFKKYKKELQDRQVQMELLFKAAAPLPRALIPHKGTLKVHKEHILTPAKIAEQKSNFEKYMKWLYK